MHGLYAHAHGVQQKPLHKQTNQNKMHERTTDIGFDCIRKDRK